MTNSLTARLQIILNDVAFVAEEDYETLDELRIGMEVMSQHLGSRAVITLEAALLYFYPETGLDENSQVVIGRMLHAMGMGAEDFFSEPAGSYDRYTNRVTAANMGLVFPDGSVRIVWENVQSKESLRASYALVSQAIDLLVAAQGLPYSADEDEDENDILQNERTDILRRHGMAVPG